uniref:U5 small nuclear ribonucleoprotein 40 kDa protein n=1 Tax=Loa loa TaxID=7209 RepID=A0A1I7VFB2_LOALO
MVADNLVLQMADVMQNNDGFKRPTMPLAVVGLKKPRLEVVSNGRPQSIPRTSHLMAPIMLLSGHDGEIYTAKFSPDGSCLASAGFDMTVFLWNVYGECENFSTLKGHAGAIMDLHFSTDAGYLFTASTDKTVRVWDMDTGTCVRKFKSHKDIVNSCHPARRGPQLVASGSDDCTVLIHDIRRRDPVITLQNAYQITAVTFNDTAEQVIGGGIDNDIKVWDLRRNELAHVMRGHTDTVTGLSLSPEGTHVLSNAMDCSSKIWDIRPFAPEQRCVKSFAGHQHNFEKNLLKCTWSPDNNRISCGSSDRYVYVWDVSSRRVLYKLPGHQGSVNATDFHPKEPILITLCLWKDSDEM